MPSDFHTSPPWCSFPCCGYWLCRGVLCYRIISLINCDANATQNGHLVSRQICILSLWKNRHVAFFIAPTDSVLCLRSINRLHGSPLTSQRFWGIKYTLLRTLLRHMNVTPTRQRTQYQGSCHGRNNTLLPPPSFLRKLIFASLTKIKPSSLCPFGRFVYFSRLGLLGWIYLDMHHVMAPRPGQSCGIIAVLQNFLHSGTQSYVEMRRVNRGVNDNPLF